jgi:hypothetical protein
LATLLHKCKEGVSSENVFCDLLGLHLVIWCAGIKGCDDRFASIFKIAFRVSYPVIDLNSRNMYEYISGVTVMLQSAFKACHKNE